jgi:hypothetical protein
MITDLTQLRVTPHNPRLPVIHKFLSDLSLIFPLNVLDFFCRRAKHVRIYSSIELQLPQLMDRVHPPSPLPDPDDDRDTEISGPDHREAPDAGTPAPWADAMFDTPDETELNQWQLSEEEKSSLVERKSFAVSAQLSSPSATF